MSADDTDVQQLVHDLTGLTDELMTQCDGVLKRGAVEVKKQLQRRFRGSRSFRRVAEVIDFEAIGKRDQIGYEIGANRDKAVAVSGVTRTGRPRKRRGTGRVGNLAHIAVDGGARGGGGSVSIDDIAPAEMRVIERHISAVLKDLL